jgi:predicted phosphodiesterase
MRALILSDIHGNLEALTAVLAAAQAAGGYDQLWNLGDMVGYGGAPNQVINLIRPLETLVVRGNHDRVCSGLSSLTGFNPVARAAALWTRDELTDENREWLLALPQGPVTPVLALATAAECPLAAPIHASCVHGSPLDEDQYILNMRDAWAPLQQMQTPITFFGHTHIQGGFAQRDHEWSELRPRFPLAAPLPPSPNSRPASLLRRARPATVTVNPRNEPQSWTLTLEPGTRHLINPGSVGQPRDFDWRAAFVLFDDVAATVTFHRVPYDLVASQGRILMAGLPERLAARLREGR